MAEMMPPHFCHSPLKVVPISAATMQIINLKNSPKYKPTKFFTEDKAKIISDESK